MASTSCFVSLVASTRQQLLDVTQGDLPVIHASLKSLFSKLKKNTVDSDPVHDCVVELHNQLVCIAIELGVISQADVDATDDDLEAYLALITLDVFGEIVTASSDNKQRLDEPSRALWDHTLETAHERYRGIIADPHPSIPNWKLTEFEAALHYGHVCYPDLPIQFKRSLGLPIMDKVMNGLNDSLSHTTQA